MTHDEADSELSALIDGALAAPRKAAVEAHLAGCADCRERLAGLKSSIALFRAHGRREAPAALKTRVLAKAQYADAAPPAVPAWRPVLTWSFVAAGALFISMSVLKEETPPANMIQGFSVASNSSFTDGGAAESGPVDEDKVSVQAPKSMVAVKGMRAASRSFRRPAQAIELEGMSSGASVGGAGEPEAAPPVGGPQAKLLVFTDRRGFEQYWASKTMLPAPKVDFDASMVAVLSGAPAGSVWTVLTTMDAADGRELRLLYKQNPAPMARDAGAAMPPLPPAFRILPKSDKSITLQKSR